MIPGLSVEPAGTSNQVLEFVGDAFKQNPRQKKTSGYLPGAILVSFFRQETGSREASDTEERVRGLVADNLQRTNICR